MLFTQKAKQSNRDRGTQWMREEQDMGLFMHRFLIGKRLSFAYEALGSKEYQYYKIVG